MGVKVIDQLKPYGIVNNGAATAARLAVEAGAVRRSGGEVVIFQPTCANRAVMGLDMIDPHRRQAVTAQAQSSVGEWLGRPSPSRQLEDILAAGRAGGLATANTSYSTTSPRTGRPRSRTGSLIRAESAGTCTSSRLQARG